MKSHYILVCSLCIFLLSPCAVKAQQELFRNEQAPIEARVNNLLSILTTDEKISLLIATSPGIPRLEINKYYHGNEALHGVVRPGKFTVFPQAIALAAMWNPDLHYQIASAISDEARARWNELDQGEKQLAHFSDLLTFWSPTVNMARDPRWGRTPETYGEDPYLAGVLGAQFVKGLQGNDPRYLKVVSTPKHFVANNEEHNRFECSVNVPERILREYYLPAFEACVKNGNAQSIMTAYPSINGVPCTANPWLIKKVLRGDWGFDGYVVSDCGAPGFIVSAHKYVKTKETAATLAIKAGLDLECGDDVFTKPLQKAYRMGMVTDADIDSAAFHILRARMRLGLFDDPMHVPYNKISPSVIGSPEHKALALEAARQSFVLLKNEKNMLPIQLNEVKSIAVMGINADTCVFGDYSGNPIGESVSILEGIRNKVGNKAKITFTPWKAPVNETAIRNSDLAIAVLGINKSIEQEGRDRNDLTLPKVQEDFIRHIYQLNPRTIVVLVAGSSLAINWMNDHIPAIVNAWYPGQEGGTAVADVLFGDFNPSGRLPLTYYNSLSELPPFNDYDVTKGRTYQYFKGKPLYPFGYGLSYTTFKYKNLKTAEEADSVSIHFSVKNDGNRDGYEIAQLYTKFPDQPELVIPIKQLKGFKKVFIKKGETQNVVIKIKKADLRLWDEKAEKFFTPQGTYTFMVGASSADIRLQENYELR